MSLWYGGHGLLHLKLNVPVEVGVIVTVLDCPGASEPVSKSADVRVCISWVPLLVTVML